MIRMSFVFFVSFVVSYSYNGFAADIPTYRQLFNGKDLSGWVNVNTDKDTFTVRDGMIICKGKPTGVMRTEKQYENFLLHVDGQRSTTIFFSV